MINWKKKNEPEIVTYDYNRGSKETSIPVSITLRISKTWTNSRAVAARGTRALQFDHNS